MNYPKVERLPTKKVLFVWDGTKHSVKTADLFASKIQFVSVRSVHVIPHESIYAYGVAGHVHDEKTVQERRLQSAFEKVTRSTSNFRNAKLELLFGERIVEIARLASIVKADFILMPTFNQSLFSNWLHGDLNSRMQNKASCPVTFYDSQVHGCPLIDSDIPKTENDSSSSTGT